MERGDLTGGVQAPVRGSGGVLPLMLTDDARLSGLDDSEVPDLYVHRA